MSSSSSDSSRSGNANLPSSEAAPLCIRNQRLDGERHRAAVARTALGARTMRRLLAGLAGFGLLCALAGCADPGTRGLATGEAAATTTAAPRPRAAPVKQRDSPLQRPADQPGHLLPADLPGGGATWPPSGISPLHPGGGRGRRDQAAGG